ncbi:hypothetical protein AF72_00030 [Xylella taiwanensis]|uniref:Uncharacterized protein n=1 Tax=Xylella taiwanensis TaxID=1444770 RepID=Z9JN35_9GAMM|nr:hypothetical protein AB672_00100 [Xylella taiwanensis]EWS79418.1 hypothetical protein AF72_00030 [Xylella taiwanensis]
MLPTFCFTLIAQHCKYYLRVFALRECQQNLMTNTSSKFQINAGYAAAHADSCCIRTLMLSLLGASRQPILARMIDTLAQCIFSDRYEQKYI